MIPLSYYLVVGAMLFGLGLLGLVINRKNLLIFLMCIELLLLAVNTNFVALAHYLGDLTGQVVVFFVLTVAAAETAVALAILVVLFRHYHTIEVEELGSLRG